MTLVSIFKICSPNTNNIYLGITTKPYIYDLFQQYKYNYNLYKKYKSKNNFRKYFEILDCEDAYFVLLERVHIETASEKFKILRKYKIDHHEQCINFAELFGVNTVRKYKRTPKKKKSQEATQIVNCEKSDNETQLRP